METKNVDLSNSNCLQCRSLLSRIVLLFLLLQISIAASAQSVFCSEKPIIPNTLTAYVGLNKLPYHNALYPSLNCYYGINNWAEAGLFTGFCQEKDTQTYANENVFYDRFFVMGADVKAHIINIFYPKFKLIDVYLSAKPYVIHERENIPMLGINDSYSKLFFNVYSGLSINVSSHFGLSFEYGLLQGDILGNDKDFRFGLYYRFSLPERN